MNITQEICKILDSKKAQDIVVVDIRHLTVIADDFIICSGRSTTQVKALANYVDDEMSKLGRQPLRSEGKQEGRWAVVDYGDVIVHIFNDETRLFYHLETLWDEGKNVTRY